ncbi:hypothetical protein [Tepidibacter thalassicus]|uniref:Short C-terminal domain-containing protein n=1 Tax=Tepidibacter thalassicus DSM 15285 TaxID=1123350 RepID=A0A1M5RA34_9FIRM|nr:hypothetical protein [Tepidibacter thalassicus]SHH23202.1 hypothetical protein SAMN02744040_01302 [Tepidibacter thalassicus DSM 15285]
MKVNARMKKIITSVLIGGTVISSLGLAAFADSSNSAKFKNASRMNNMVHQNFRGQRNNFEDRINKLVEEGIITEDEAIKWKEFHDQNQGKRQFGMRGKNRGQGMVKLVEAGVISQERADEIQEKIHEIRVQENQQRFEDRINKLVEEGIITEDEAVKWREFHAKKVEERKAEMEKIKDKR